MKKIHIPGLLLLFAALWASCIKTPVGIETAGTEGDPDLVYIDNYKVDISTYKSDSAITSGHQVFMTGTHHDSLFSKISSNSYAEVELPATNPVKNKDVLFDSLVLALTPNGNYYGDTMLPLKISVHELTQNIENEDDADLNFYYPRSFSHYAAPLAQTARVIKPRRKEELTLRLPDAMGADWLMKLKRDDTEIQSQSNFRKFFRGVCIKTDSMFNNIIYYFTAGAGNAFIRLHYRERGLVTTEKMLEFRYVTARQFNNISYNSTTTPFSVFTPYKKQLKSSAFTGGRVFVSNNMPSYAKITFPGLLSLKELYPFIKVVKAQLEIKAAAGSYRYPYQLPPALQMYVSLSGNNFDQLLLGQNGQPQNGSLQTNGLYSVNNHYTFDVTSYIGVLLEEGRFSTKSLFLAAAAGIDSESARLVINDQQSASGIRLKLYLLGL
jgi:Domain of unknown function (DUF4270)